MGMLAKLLVIPCSQSKKGLRSVITPRTIDDFISPEVSEILREGRRAAFQRPGTQLYLNSETVPALFRYTGTMYSIEGFRDAIQGAVANGLHVLVESGGYGLVRIEEEIHDYEAPINRTAAIWGSVLPRVLADYVLRNRITSVYVAGSQSYARVLRRYGWWNTTECRWFVAYAGRGCGNPYEIVPRALGTAVRDLITSDIATAPAWPLYE